MSSTPHRLPCHSVHHIKAGQIPESGSQGRGPCGLEAGAGVWCPVLGTQLPVNLSSENTATRFVAPGPASRQDSLDLAAPRPPWPFNCCRWPGHLDGQSACCHRSPERSPTLRTQALPVQSREVSTCALSPRALLWGEGAGQAPPPARLRRRDRLPGACGSGRGPAPARSPSSPLVSRSPWEEGRREGPAITAAAVACYPITRPQKLPRLRFQNVMSDEAWIYSQNVESPERRRRTAAARMRRCPSRRSGQSRRPRGWGVGEGRLDWCQTPGSFSGARASARGSRGARSARRRGSHNEVGDLPRRRQRR